MSRPNVHAKVSLVVGLHLNERDQHGRLICPGCERAIRVSDQTHDDGMHLRHAECHRGIVSARWEGRIVRVHVRPGDWEDAGWRQNFEADLRRTGWRLVSLEPPSNSRPEYVYILTPEAEDSEL